MNSLSRKSISQEWRRHLKKSLNDGKLKECDSSLSIPKEILKEIFYTEKGTYKRRNLGWKKWKKEQWKEERYREIQ